MRKSQMELPMLIREYERSIVRLTHYPNNKSYLKEYEAIQKELAKRLNIDPEGLKVN
jgi:hypothetical protein